MMGEDRKGQQRRNLRQQVKLPMVHLNVDLIA